MSMKFRFAGPGDAEKFARWAAENPQIERADILAATKEQNPTTTYLVIEDDAGEPRLFMPVYLTMRIGYLGFNPENDSEASLAAMEMMLQAVKAFAGAYQIGSIDTLTRTGIPVAAWARRHGFKADQRELYTLRVANVCTAPEKGSVH